MKDRKTFVRWLSLLLIVVAVIGITVVSAKETAPKAAGLALEDMPIVVSANATKVEKTAAKELQAYLKKLTGSASAVVTEGVSLKSAIYIGKTAFSADKNVTYTDNNGMGEGWVVKVIDDDVIIDGGDTRGVLYAVYHLLEDTFGIHWWNMWEEYVPELDSAVLPYDFEISGEPVFADRGIYSNESMGTLYYVRNRLNGWTSNGSPAYGDEENFGRPYHVHTFNRYLPAEYSAPTSESSAKWTDAMNPDRVDWFEVHPEWYAWMESRQERISFGQFCMSSEGLLEALTERVLIAIEMSYEDADKAGKARPKYIDISPNDTGNFCECADCRKAVATCGPSGHLLKFVNKIAAVVAEHYPEIKVETLAYWQYFEVPLDDTVPADNVVIRLASSDIDLMHDLDHPNNAKAKARLYKWAELLKPGQLRYWDYGITSSTGGIVTNYFKYQSDWQKFHEVGGFGMFIEQQKFNTSDFWDLKHWVQTKLMEDPYQDVHELVKTFLRGYYGEAAAEDLYDYLVYVTENAKDWEKVITFNGATFTSDAEWMDGNEALVAWQFFADAVEKTEGDDSLTATEKELFLNRIGAARTALDRVIIKNHYRFSTEVAKNGDPDHLFNIDRSEVATHHKEALRWLADMELTDDHTGTQTVNRRGSYNDVESTINSYANLMNQESDYYPYPEIPNPPLPEQIFEDHPGIDEKHIIDFPSHLIWSASTYGAGWEWIEQVPNAASYEGGMAIKYDQEKMLECNVAESSIESYYSFSETKPIFSNTTRKLYLGAPLIADGEYHLYRMKDMVVYTNAKTELSLFADSMLLSLGSNMQHLKDKVVDVYVSMKIEGDPSFTDKRNLGAWYIDRFIIVMPCEECDIEYTIETPATCASNASRSGMCPICGKMVTEEYEYTRLEHKLTGDFYYDEATGLYKAPCATCGEAEFDFAGRLPENLEKSLRETGTSLDYLYMYDIDDFREVKYTSFIEVEDADSAMGRAAMYDLAMENVQYFEITDAKPFRDLEGRLPGVPAKDIVTDGQYHLYPFEDVVLSTGGEFHFFDWSLSVDFTKLPIDSQKVDLYVSMKVEGELKYDDLNNLPKYYIDRMFVVGNCQAHVADSYTFDADKNAYIGTCVNCGGLVKHQFAYDLPEEVYADIKTNDVDYAHVHAYTADDVQLYGGMTKVEDAASAVGFAALSKNYTGAASSFIIKQYAPEKTVATIPYGTLKANAGNGYQVYKFEDLTLPKNPASGEYYLLFFGWNMQTRKMVAELGGKTVDLYVSMKVEGDPATGADFYIDQIIAIDGCAPDMEALVIKTPAACGTNAVGDTVCLTCKKTIQNVEVPNTMLEHDFTEDPNTCSICGESKLPKEVSDGLAAKGMSVEHAHIYGADDFSLSGMTRVTDPDSVVGYAAKKTGYTGAAGGLKFGSYSPEKTIGTISLADLKANGGEYKIYKFADVKLPKNPVPVTNEWYVWTLGWQLQNKQLIREIGGKTVDLYISMKVVGDPSAAKGADFYVDQMFAVDTCADYSESEYVFGAGTGTCQDAAGSVGKCPVCGKENPAYTKPGTAGKHSFTKYIQDKYDVVRYVAECDYGCGATDVKERKALTLEEKLPEGFPAQAAGHVIATYMVGEFGLHADEDYYMWDPELDYPVGVRPCLKPDHKYLNMQASNGIELSMYVGSGTTKTPARIYASELAANSGKGYQLYSFENVILMVERENHYFYMFKDWCLQIRMLHEDLEDYYQKPVDIHVYMKVEGDVNCSSGYDNLPTYTIASVIVTEKCTPDDSWTVLEPATCDKLGRAVGNCAVCGCQNVETSIPKLKHEIINPVVRIQPTCEFDAEYKGVCAICGLSVNQEAEGTKLTHSFTTYIKQDDGTEYAFCDHGCGERHFRNSVSYGENLQLPEPLQPIIPILGGAAGGSSFGFSDIKESDWYFESVKEAWSNKLINGVTATEFRPNETLTVAQAVKLASAYHEMNYTGDVTLENGRGNWYSSYVDYAVENGIIDRGYASKSNAEMNKPIDRSEFVAIFAKAMDEGSLVGYNDVADNAIPDVKADDENADAIYKFYRAGILTGSDGKGTFNPTSSIKRCEVATILSRMYNENVRQSITLN